MAEKIQQLESLVIRSLRRFRDHYFPDKVVEADLAVGDSGKEEQQYGFLDTLPVSRIRIIHRRIQCTSTYVAFMPLIQTGQA